MFESFSSKYLMFLFLKYENLLLFVVSPERKKNLFRF